MHLPAHLQLEQTNPQAKIAKHLPSEPTKIDMLQQLINVTLIMARC